MKLFTTMPVKLIAYYLPQFHPIPENDEWWGKGFTEWTNVAKAKPLFKGHYQPRLPADLGFYDLRVPEVRDQQAELAREHGIYGFCYYHYWFGNGKQLLERPFNDVLASGKPDFPFMLCWANETWKGVWFGASKGKVLIEQKYPGRIDYINHFHYLLKAFEDHRYIRISGKPVFMIYKPLEVPNLKEMVDSFRESAAKSGIGELFLLANRVSYDWNPIDHGFDGVVGSELSSLRFIQNYKKARRSEMIKRLDAIKRRIFKNGTGDFENRSKPFILDYSEALKGFLPDISFNFPFFPCAVPDWDNSARSGSGSMILKNSTPRLFGSHLLSICEYTINNNKNAPIAFIKSWNEWAEGNYLEPDSMWGLNYLITTRDVIRKISEKYRID